MKGLKKALIFLLVLVGAAILAVLAIRLMMVFSAGGKITAEGELPEKQAESYDGIIVLGAGVYQDGSLSPMLTYRMERALELFEAGYAEKILVTGDHRAGEYDETDHMAEWLIARGVPDEKILRDYRGYSTFDSMHRAAVVFGIRRGIVVTQKYHLYRSLFIGRLCEIELQGAEAKDWGMSAGTVWRHAREVLASVKDFWNCLRKLK